MRRIHWLLAVMAWAMPLFAPVAWGDEPAPCDVTARRAIDLQLWRQLILKAGSDELERTLLLEAMGFETRGWACLDGKVIAVDIIPATFGALPHADRIVQITTQNCLPKREMVVLTAQPDATWCLVRGQFHTASMSPCSLGPYSLQLVRLTDAHHDTLRIDYSEGGMATPSLHPSDKVCDTHRFTTFYDVRDNTFAFVLKLEGGGPVTWSGPYPRVVRAVDDSGGEPAKMKTYRFTGQQYETKD